MESLTAQKKQHVVLFDAPCLVHVYVVSIPLILSKYEAHPSMLQIFLETYLARIFNFLFMFSNTHSPLSRDIYGAKITFTGEQISPEISITSDLNIFLWLQPSSKHRTLFLTSQETYLLHLLLIIQVVKALYLHSSFSFHFAVVLDTV